jgi:hypothetical protein
MGAILNADGRRAIMVMPQLASNQDHGNHDVDLKHGPA